MYSPIIPTDGASIAGGWHDAADLTQGTGKYSRIVHRPPRNGRCRTRQRQYLLRTPAGRGARWGVNWILRTRFGDGYRLGGLIIGIWTKNIRGDKTTMQTEARNTPTDNLKAASSCALAAPHFEKKDPVFCTVVPTVPLRTSIRHRPAGYTKDGTERNRTLCPCHRHSHAFVPPTQDVYYLTGQPGWHVPSWQANSWKNRLENPLRGFFYESSRKSVFWPIITSQEHLMAEGLSMLLTDAPPIRTPCCGRHLVKPMVTIYAGFTTD